MLARGGGWCYSPGTHMLTKASVRSVFPHPHRCISLQVVGHNVKIMLADPRVRRSQSQEPTRPWRDMDCNAGGPMPYGLHPSHCYPHYYPPGGPVGYPPPPASHHHHAGHNMRGRDFAMFPHDVHGCNDVFLPAGVVPPPFMHVPGGAESAYAAAAPISSAASGSRQRLFVVVSKAATHDVLAKLFRRVPGMEYCDLKTDKASGKSKVRRGNHIRNATAGAIGPGRATSKERSALRLFVGSFINVSR